MSGIKIRCQEWGVVNSHFRNNALQFTYLTALQEKIDNSYSADASEFIFGLNSGNFFIYDDIGMNPTFRFLDVFKAQGGSGMCGGCGAATGPGYSPH